MTMVTTVIEWAFSEVASAAIRSVLSKRLEGAREILLSELSVGSALGELPADEIASAALRYLRAAEEGAGRRNLRLMAQVMKNLRPQAPSLYADEFLRWADVLGSLRREECIAVATLYRTELTLAEEGQKPENIPGLAVVSTQGELVSRAICASEAEVTQTLSSAMRSGLIVSNAAWGGTIYYTTPLMAKLALLVNIEDLGSDET